MGGQRQDVNTEKKTSFPHLKPLRCLQALIATTDTAEHFLESIWSPKTMLREDRTRSASFTWQQIPTHTKAPLNEEMSENIRTNVCRKQHWVTDFRRVQVNASLHLSPVWICRCPGGMTIIQIDTGRETSLEEMQKERPFFAASIESCDQSTKHRSV